MIHIENYMLFMLGERTRCTLRARGVNGMLKRTFTDGTTASAQSPLLFSSFDAYNSSSHPDPNSNRYEFSEAVEEDSLSDRVHDLVLVCASARKAKSAEYS